MPIFTQGFATSGFLIEMLQSEVNWTFITWTIFAIYLHIQTNPNLEGVNSAIVTSLGFLIIWICYLGVNLGIGLHSYGTFTLTSN